MRKTFSIAVALAAAMFSGACNRPSRGSAVSAGQEDGSSGLAALFREMAAAADAKDVAKGQALALSLLPDRPVLRKVLLDEVDDTVRKGILAPYLDISPSPQLAARAFVPGGGMTEVHVYAATTEQLIAYERGSLAMLRFPTGAQRLARAALRPNMTFYEVEITPPGAPTGVKYHMFFWDGSRWRTLGSAWHAIAR